jgi:hypothetical protein
MPKVMYLISIVKPTRCTIFSNLLYFVVTNEMGRACGAYGGGERCAQGVGGEA